jgi:hypothetical protein
MTTSALGRRRGGWQRPVSLPADLAELRGPLTGLVRLPLSIYASGQGPARSFDLSNEAERVELYEIVLTDGTAKDVCRYVNREELMRLWPRLWLPPHVRQVWEPRLGCRRLVSLDPLHEQIARIAFGLLEAGQVALAAGGAMLAHDLVDRPTQDVDLFTPDPAEVTQLTDALAVALRTEGAAVRVDRRGPGFTRLGVTVADGRSVVVEIAHDARIREAVQLSFARVLHPDELAADKTLALLGRAAARDLVDVAALSKRYPLQASRPKRTPVSTAEFSRRVGRRGISL